MAIAIDPTSITYFQHAYITTLSGLFGHFVKIATNLFYVLAALELALFGIAWALRQDEALGSLAFKIFKLAVIFFIITSYPNLVQNMIDGFTSMSSHAISTTDSTNYLLNPGLVWQFGFNHSIALLKLAVQYGTFNVGISLIYIILGFGMLFMFGLIGAVIVLLIVGFYVVSLVALLLLPFGTLSVMRNFLSSTLTAVIAMGVRVFALVLVLGIAFSVWASLGIKTITQTTTLSEPLGLFFVTLVILVLVLKVPSWAANTVGKIGGSIFDELKSATAPQPSTAVSVSSPVYQQPAAFGMTSASGSISSASTTVSGANMTSAAGAVSGGGVSATTPSTQAVNVSTTSQGVNQASALGHKGRVGKSVEVGISHTALKNLKKTFKEAIRDSKKS